ncbi:hypothetical protein COCOBI_08-0270 [Coccomyxa sp. Obi]|nr:hypothetical protein COCOBI_08-0270 [Coccomyxa sp. Obi]
MSQPKPKAGRRPPTAFPHLPEEIWLRIASLLSTKEWAGASGACRALQQLQLEHIDMAATSAQDYSSALDWLKRRMGSAKSAALDGWPVSNDAQADCGQQINLAVQAQLNPTLLPRLAVLRAKIELPQGVPKYSEEFRKEPREFASILRQAVNLSMVELVCGSIPFLPEMASLKHLALSVEDPNMDSERLSPMLQAMPCFKTLQLSQSSWDQCMHSHYSQPVGTLVVPTSVQRLELTNIFPKSLELCSGSTVVVMGGSLCCMRYALVRWPGVRGQIKGVCLHDELSGEIGGFNETLPGLWRSVEVLQFVSDIQRSLHGLTSVSIANLTALHIKDVGLSVCIPARLTLKDVRIEVRYKLCIEFEDAAVTSRHVDLFEATFKETCDVDSLMDFCRAMQDTGKAIMVEEYDAARNYEQSVYFLHCGKNQSVTEVRVRGTPE